MKIRTHKRKDVIIEQGKELEGIVKVTHSYSHCRESRIHIHVVNQVARVKGD